MIADKPRSTKPSAGAGNTYSGGGGNLLDSRRFLPFMVLLFVGSGCAALIYEVVWLQLLGLVIGASAISLGVLLGTFMGGMCLGSLLFPKFVSRSAHPLRVYAVLELLIGVVGLWFFIPGIASIVGSFASDANRAAVPVMKTGTILGGALLACAVLLWGRAPWPRPSRRTNRREPTAEAAVNPAGGVFVVVAFRRGRPVCLNFHTDRECGRVRAELTDPEMEKLRDLVAYPERLSEILRGAFVPERSPLRVDVFTPAPNGEALVAADGGLHVIAPCPECAARASPEG